MPSIDERIVSMSFENRKFEAAVKQTMTTLSKLETALQNIGTKTSLSNIEKEAAKVTLLQPMSALDKLRSRLYDAGRGAAEGFSAIENAGSKVSLLNPLTALDRLRTRLFGVGDGAAQGFSDIESASQKVDFRALNSSIDSVQSKFSALTVVATSALSTVTMDAVRRGKSFATSFAFGPITQGLAEYKTNLSSIQTILANTQGQKVSGLDNVNKALSELNTYSDKTIYNFSEMAKNIGTFTAAGVDLPKSVAAIKGIANLAALSGSNSQQASTAMYQLSQAIAAGRVGLQDWNSVVNAGMGGAVFQKSLMRTAENMGALEKGAVKIDKATGKATVNGESFRNSIMAKPGEQSWLSSEVLTETLSQMTGDLTDAQLAAKGFTKEQIKAIQAQAKTAQDAATQVKTLSQVFDVAKETIGSGWSRTFQLIFGDFGESKKTFTELSNTINGVINRISNARNKILGEWKKLGGRTALIDGIKNAFKGLASILKPIQDAFRDIFPRTTGRQLADLTKRFRDLMENFKIGPETADLLRRTFRGFFALLDIGRQIVGGIFSAFAKMFGIISDNSGGFLTFTANVGDAITAFRDFLDEGDRLKKFFESLPALLAAPAELISTLFDGLSALFNGADVSDITGNSLHSMNTQLTPMAKLVTHAEAAWSGLVGVLRKVAHFLDPIVKALGNALSAVGDAISNAFSSENVDKFLSGLQVGLIGAIFLSIKKAFGGKGGFSFKAEIGGLSDSLNIMTGSLKSMQQAVQATTLLEIAAAVALLAVSVAILSKIDDKKLTKSMTAMSVGLGELVGAMKILGTGAGGKTGFVKIPVIAAGMVLLSGALLVLTGTMFILSKMDWTGIAKGLAGVTGLLAGLAVAVQPMSKAGPGIILASAGMIAVSAAMVILAGTMKILATMNWGDLLKGLAGVVLAIDAVAVASRALGPGLLITGPGLILMSIALVGLATAVGMFGSLDLVTIGKGIFGIAGALLAIGLAIGTMPLTLPITSAGLILVGIALAAITASLGALGNMSIGTLVKGIGAMGIALVTLAAGLTLMIASLPGAAALLVAAGALALLAPTLGFLGNLKWGTIGKGLLTMALVIGAIAVGGLVAAPALIALGVALAIFGAGLLPAAFAVKLLASGFAQLSDSGTKGMTAFLAAATAFLTFLPKLIIDFLKGMVEVAESVVKLAPPLVEALGKIIAMLIDMVIKQTPKFAEAVEHLIEAFGQIIIKETPTVINAAMALILGLLRGLDEHIGEITQRAVTIITKFLNELASGVPKMAEAGSRLVINFLEGVAKHASEIAGKGLAIITKILNGIAQGIPSLITAGGNIIVKLVEGFGNQSQKIADAGINAATNFIRHMARTIPKKADQIATAIIKMLHRMATVIRHRGPEFIWALADVGEAIVEGIIRGMAGLPGRLWEKVKEALSFIPGPIKDFLHLNVKDPDEEKPKKVPRGKGADAVDEAVDAITRGRNRRRRKRGRGALLSNTRTALGDFTASSLDIRPTITPVLDLSEVQREAKRMPSLASPRISTDATLRQARAILAEKAAADSVRHARLGKQDDRPTVHFVQNNHSPEALPEREIYRRTHNQLSRVKAEMRKHHAHK